MKRFALLLVLIAAPAFAQDTDETPGEGTDLMEEALKLFMRGLMQEIEPALDDLSNLLDNLDAYHPPEILPNGDIIIRRRRPVEPKPDEDGEVEL